MSLSQKFQSPKWVALQGWSCPIASTQLVFFNLLKSDEPTKEDYFGLAEAICEVWPNLQEKNLVPVESSSSGSSRVATVRHYLSLNNRKRRGRGSLLQPSATNFNFRTATLAKRRAYLVETLEKKECWAEFTGWLLGSFFKGSKVTLISAQLPNMQC